MISYSSLTNEPFQKPHRSSASFKRTRADSPGTWLWRVCPRLQELLHLLNPPHFSVGHTSATATPLSFPRLKQFNWALKIIDYKSFAAAELLILIICWAFFSPTDVSTGGLFRYFSVCFSKLTESAPFLLTTTLAIKGTSNASLYFLWL